MIIISGPPREKRSISSTAVGARFGADRPMIIAHRRNTLDAIHDALRQGADGIEVDIRLHRGTLVLAHDPVPRGQPGLLSLEDLYDQTRPTASIVYLDFKDDVVGQAAALATRLDELERSIFFAESRAAIQSLARTKRRLSSIVANVSLRHESVGRVEQALGGLPEFIQIGLWTPAAIRTYIARRTRVAFDTMSNLDLFPALGVLARPFVRPALEVASLVQTDHPQRFVSPGGSARHPTPLTTTGRGPGPFGPERPREFCDSKAGSGTS